MAAKGITYNDILRDLKAQKVAPVYYLMGEEDYYIDKLSDALMQILGDNINKEQLSERAILAYSRKTMFENYYRLYKGN